MEKRKEWVEEGRGEAGEEEEGGVGRGGRRGRRSGGKGDGGRRGGGRAIACGGRK